MEIRDHRPELSWPTFQLIVEALLTPTKAAQWPYWLGNRDARETVTVLPPIDYRPKTAKDRGAGPQGGGPPGLAKLSHPRPQAQIVRPTPPPAAKTIPPA